ncbi:hypothetical protein SynPROS71_00955 [Synechococcus sp. PROS-7-1]|nr:hypothetical protein SynPROS71_00955 [Synechococcus sp. PROS-7-1]
MVSELLKFSLQFQKHQRKRTGKVPAEAGLHVGSQSGTH